MLALACLVPQIHQSKTTSKSQNNRLSLVIAYLILFIYLLAQIHLLK